jgi:hypothetical protein
MERDYSEYDFNPDIGSHEGFSVGDQVVITEDHEEMGYFEGEEGTVIGFSVIAPATDKAAAMAFGNDPDGRTAIYILMDGTDEPIEVQPGRMEVA